MVRMFYAELLHDEPELLQEARAVAPRAYELFTQRQRDFLRGDFGST